MSCEATVVTLGARPPLALPEKPRQESRWEQRSEVAKTTRGMFRADPSEGERITHFGVDAEVQSDCGCLAGSFDKIAHTARTSAVEVVEVADTLKRSSSFFFEAEICSFAWASGIAVRRRCGRVRAPEYEKRVCEPSLMK